MIDEPLASAFWSYAHEDDVHDHGQVVSLAEVLANEFGLITGRRLEIFVDRTSIEWGEEWRRRIDSALADTTLFIPIVTPRYFTRDECRRELLAFVGQAESLGFHELLLPILYAPLTDLSEDNPDEAVAVIARTQYVDFTELRLTDRGSEEFRKTVNRLARRLARACASAEAIKRERELAGTNADAVAESPALVELFADIKALLPEWLDAVQVDQVTSAQTRGVTRLYNAKLEKIRSRGLRGGAEFAVLTSFAKELRPMAERHIEAAKVYLARTLEIDPLAQAAFRAIRDHPEAFDLLEELAAGVEEATENIAEWERDFASGRVGRISQTAKERAHISRLWRELSDIYASSDKMVFEANELVKGWDQELRNLQRSGDEPESQAAESDDV